MARNMIVNEYQWCSLPAGCVNKKQYREIFTVKAHVSLVFPLCFYVLNIHYCGNNCEPVTFVGLASFGKRHRSLCWTAQQITTKLKLFSLTYIDNPYNKGTVHPNIKTVYFPLTVNQETPINHLVTVIDLCCHVWPQSRAVCGKLLVAVECIRTFVSRYFSIE